MIIELGEGGKVLYFAAKRRQAQSDSLRPPGLHLGDIIRDIDLKLNPVREEIENPILLSLFELGDIVETIIGEELAARQGWIKPEPRKVDGIWVSPDGWNPLTRTLDECKATWCSSKSGLKHPKLWKYIVQCKSYMHCWGSTKMRLHVMYMRGNYKDQPFPEPHTYILKYSPADLARTWQMVKDHADDMRAA